MPVRVAIVTISENLNSEEDHIGGVIREYVEKAGHKMAHYLLVGEHGENIRTQVENLADSSEVEAILISGGTGIPPNDLTHRYVYPSFSRTIPGYSEFLRRLLFEEIGPGAMFTEAFAGIRDHVLIFTMPASDQVVSIAMEKLILPVLRPSVLELRKGFDPQVY